MIITPPLDSHFPYHVCRVSIREFLEGGEGEGGVKTTIRGGKNSWWCSDISMAVGKVCMYMVPGCRSDPLHTH